LARLKKRGKARNARTEAAQLLGKWTSLSQGHVLMGGNCSCGLGGGSLQIGEFEQQILDYLDGKHALRDASLSALLRSITASAGEADQEKWLSVLDDLKRTLESFEEVHRAT
jgi:hypothetical protein